MFMKRERGLNSFRRFVMPMLSILGCLFMVVAAVFAHRVSALYYLIVFAAVMLIGTFYFDRSHG
jgi:APA family basic amino acid/polyamine antiporter